MSETDPYEQFKQTCRNAGSNYRQACDEANREQIRAIELADTTMTAAIKAAVDDLRAEVGPHD